MKAKIFFLFGMLSASQLLGQDDLLNMLNQEDAKKITYTQATFKGTRFINGQTVETIAKSDMEAVIELIYQSLLKVKGNEDWRYFS